jgi:hypothetical protein
MMNTLEPGIAYKVIQDNPLVPGSCKIGDTVYAINGYDYGCSREDTKMRGEICVAVTLDSNGDYPCFTIPASHLEKVK